MIAFVAISKTIGVMQIWQFPYMLTGGGPNYGTTTMVLQMYYEGFFYRRWGTAAAMGIVLMVTVLILAIVQRRILSK